MKFIFAMMSLCLTLTSFAQGGGDRVGSGDPVPPLISIEYPASPMMSTPTSRKIEVYANGHVVQTTMKYRAGQTSPEVRFDSFSKLSGETMSRVHECSGEFNESNFKPRHIDYCMDDAGIHYKGLYGQKTFAVSFCGQLQSVRSQCAKDMIKLLDSFKPRR